MFVAGIALEIIPEETRKSFKAKPENKGKLDNTGLWGWVVAYPVSAYLFETAESYSPYFKTQICPSCQLPRLHPLANRSHFSSSKRSYRTKVTAKVDSCISGNLQQGSVGAAVGQGLFQSWFFIGMSIPEMDGQMTKKYGGQWEEYKREVPYAFIPGIY